MKIAPTKSLLFISPFLFLIYFLSTGATDIQYVTLMAIWMVSWWVFEIMPLGITALIPVILLPVLGVMSTKSALSYYSHPIIFLFLGGFIIAEALEKTKLSERLAIGILRLTGKSAKGVLLGFVISTAFLSMWISNTATTVMMIPIADSILKFIEKYSDNPKNELRSFSICLMLGIAYAANIGGTMTPIGTPPNVVLMGYLQELFKLKVDFGLWMMIVSPVAIALLAATYYITSSLLYPFKLSLGEQFQIFLKNKWLMLGPINKEQRITLIVFSITCLLWIFKNLINDLIGNPLLDDTIIALAGGVSLFMLPPKVLESEDIGRLPWNIVLLFGGGMCLASSLEHVGVLQHLTGYFEALKDIDIYWFVFISSFFTLFLTEIMSNVALCTVALPIFLTFAGTQDYHPLVIGIPVTLCASYAFSMPISTPPNAIVFATGKLSVSHMMRAGIVMNIVSILMTMTLGWAMINLFIEF